MGWVGVGMGSGILGGALRLLRDHKRGTPLEGESLRAVSAPWGGDDLDREEGICQEPTGGSQANVLLRYIRFHSTLRDVSFVVQSLFQK